MLNLQLEYPQQLAVQLLFEDVQKEDCHHQSRQNILPGSLCSSDIVAPILTIGTSPTIDANSLRYSSGGIVANLGIRSPEDSTFVHATEVFRPLDLKTANSQVSIPRIVRAISTDEAAQQKSSMMVTAGNEYSGEKHHTGTGTDPNCPYVQGDQKFYDTEMILTTTFTLLLSLLGFVGNGTVIWLLGFRIKRNHFTTYILNLSIADLGVVTALLAINMYWLVARLSSLQYVDPLKTVFRTFFLVTYSTSQFLLTVISLDRCASIFLPLWYRFHQPRHLSTIACAVIWIFTFPLFPAHISLYLSFNYCGLWFSQFLLNAVVSTPAISISTVAMLIKVCLISPQHKRGKLLTAMLLALIFFLLFAFPMNVIQYISRYVDLKHPYLYEYGYICASFNSTINPFIYFLVGRERSGQWRQRIQLILEKVFKEEEDSRETGTSNSNTVEMVP
ncbi:proto-oncogene Mas-like [Sceloporus undulatus]|uniref:proto-oncogene Mas-like n=1 Tax=Sceloporus undulatus TaxID=8520 RepID=UPI001C4B52C9|nr:proto-oncogene Mas-like [Sceloporus undulatus]